jgi:acyl carrier protein
MTIEEQIMNFISSNLLFSDDSFPYSENDSFLENGIVDSIGIMELVLFIEENFNISIENGEITPMNFDSVAKLSTYVRSKMNNTY